MSHRSSPCRGASAERVTARISRFVIWPSCSNRSSGRPDASGSTIARLSATISSATVLSGSSGPPANPAACASRTRSCGPPMRFADDEARAAHAALGEEAGQRAPASSRPRRARGCARRAGAVARCARTNARAAIPARNPATPAQPRGRKAERRRSGNADHLGGIEMPHQCRPHAVEEGIARGEHADAAASPRHDAGDGVRERRRPGQPFSAYIVWQRRGGARRQRRVRLARPEAVRQERGRRGRLRRCRRWRASVPDCH